MRGSKGTTEKAKSTEKAASLKLPSVMATNSDDSSDSGSDANFGEDNAMYDNESVMASGNNSVGHESIGVQSAVVKAKNREHARNTRMRRKNFIETLKDDILLVATNRENRDKERKSALSKLADQTMERKKVLETWLSYRARVETDVEKWRAILEEDFECVMPVTPYRSFPPHQVSDGRRRLSGIPDMIFDTLSLHVMVQSMILPRNSGNTAKVTLRHEVLEDSVMAGDVYMCKWAITTENIVARGGLFEVAKEGMLLARFGPAGANGGGSKLRSVDVSFDVMSYMQQLRRTSERSAFQVIPNLVYVAQSHSVSEDAPSSPGSSHGSRGRSKSSPSMGSSGSVGSSARSEALLSFINTSDARVVISADEPYTLSFVNKKFQDTFRQRRDVAEHITHNPVPLFYHLVRPGENLPAQLDNVLAHIKSKLPCSAVLNCATAGTPRVTYPCMCCFFPLFIDGAVQQYLVIIEVIGEVLHPADWVDPDAPAVPLGVQVTETPAAQITWLDAAQSSSQAHGQRREGRGMGSGRSQASSLSAGTDFESRSSSLSAPNAASRSADVSDGDVNVAGVANAANRSSGNPAERAHQYGGSWSSHSRSRDGQSDYTNPENTSSSNMSAMTWEQQNGSNGSNGVTHHHARASHKIPRAVRNSPSPETSTHKASRTGPSPPAERGVSGGSGSGSGSGSASGSASGSGSGGVSGLTNSGSGLTHSGSGQSGSASGQSGSDSIGSSGRHRGNFSRDQGSAREGSSDDASQRGSGQNGTGSDGDSPIDSDSPSPTAEVSSATPPSDDFADPDAGAYTEPGGAERMDLSSRGTSSSSLANPGRGSARSSSAPQHHPKHQQGLSEQLHLQPPQQRDAPEEAQEGAEEDEDAEEKGASTGAAVDMTGNSETSSSVPLQETLDYFLECSSEGGNL